jgi:hypothetical protein
MTEGQVPLWQHALAGVINHGAKQAVVKAIDYLRTLSEDDAREVTQGMNPDYAARFMNVWRAACDEQTV